MTQESPGGPPAKEPVNLVRLRGKVTTTPEERELPSGTQVVAVRLSVARDQTPMTSGSKQTTDWVDCSAWGAKVRRAVRSWQAGDIVELEGALRRRFSRSQSGTATRLEVEVLSARRVLRSATEQRRRTAKQAATATPAAG
jgi:single-strand DNA-binding protein